MKWNKINRWDSRHSRRSINHSWGYCTPITRNITPSRMFTIKLPIYSTLTSIFCLNSNNFYLIPPAMTLPHLVPEESNPYASLPFPLSPFPSPSFSFPLSLHLLLAAFRNFDILLHLFLLSIHSPMTVCLLPTSWSFLSFCCLYFFLPERN